MMESGSLFTSGSGIIKSVLISLIAVRIIYEVNFVKVNEVVFQSQKLTNIDELRVLQISDFHSKRLFREKTYVNILKNTNPHVVVITGDIISKNDNSFQGAYRIIEVVLNYTDEVYFVMGNHEWNNKNREEFLNKIANMGVHILDNESKVLQIREERINLCGADDSRSRKDDLKKTFKNVDFTKLSILISHSPQILNRSEKIRCDLTLLGDTHGGQIRFPFIGALFTSQGLFPKLQKGVYYFNDKGDLCIKRKIKKDSYKVNTKLGECRAVYIDSGVGVHSLPIRLFNRSQVSLIRIAKSL